MPYLGILKQSVAYTVEIDNSPTADACGVTAVKVNKREKISSADPSTVPRNEVKQITDTPGAGIDRVIWLLSPAPGAAVIFTTIINGIRSAPLQITGDSQVTYDAIP
jgi:hypothetical protein